MIEGNEVVSPGLWDAADERVPLRHQVLLQSWDPRLCSWGQVRSILDQVTFVECEKDPVSAFVPVNMFGPA